MHTASDIVDFSHQQKVIQKKLLLTQNWDQIYKTAIFLLLLPLLNNNLVKKAIFFQKQIFDAKI